MKARYAPWIFCVTVLAFWLSLWMAQSWTRPERQDELLTLSAAELVGVKRLVWDVARDGGYYETYRDSNTLLLAGGSGDLRLTASPRGTESDGLQLVREGDTVYVRVLKRVFVLADDAGEGEESARQRYIDEPVSLILPASIAELHWPSVQLLMASKADLAQFSVRTTSIVIGSDVIGEDENISRRYSQYSDAQIAANFLGDKLPGKLARLNVQSRNFEPCANEGEYSSSGRNGSVEYRGGFFTQLHVLGQETAIKFIGMEPVLKAELHVTSNSRLEVAQVGYLSQLQIQSPSAQELRELKTPLSGAYTDANGCQKK